jgi:hypothetical protein
VAASTLEDERRCGGRTAAAASTLEDEDERRRQLRPWRTRTTHAGPAGVTAAWRTEDEWMQKVAGNRARGSPHAVATAWLWTCRRRWGCEPPSGRVDDGGAVESWAMGRSRVETILTDSVRFGPNPPSARIPPTGNGSNPGIQFRGGSNALSSRVQLNSS